MADEIKWTSSIVANGISVATSAISSPFSVTTIRLNLPSAMEPIEIDPTPSLGERGGRDPSSRVKAQPPDEVKTLIDNGAKREQIGVKRAEPTIDPTFKVLFFVVLAVCLTALVALVALPFVADPKQPPLVHGYPYIVHVFTVTLGGWVGLLGGKTTGIKAANE